MIFYLLVMLPLLVSGGFVERFDRWVEFGCVFGMFLLSGFRMVLGMIWETFWCQNEDQKAKGGFVEIFVLRK